MLEDNRNKRFRVAYITYDGAQFSRVERDITQRDLGRLLAEAPPIFSFAAWTWTRHGLGRANRTKWSA